MINLFSFLHITTSLYCWFLNRLQHEFSRSIEVFERNFKIAIFATLSFFSDCSAAAELPGLHILPVIAQVPQILGQPKSRVVAYCGVKVDSCFQRVCPATVLNTVWATATEPQSGCQIIFTAATAQRRLTGNLDWHLYSNIIIIE